MIERPSLTLKDFAPKLQDTPLDWSFETYCWIEDATYLINPKSEPRVRNGEYEELDVWSVLLSPVDNNYQDKIQPRLDQAVQYIQSSYVDDTYKPRLGVFHRYSLSLESLFSISLRGEKVNEKDRLEGRVAAIVFNLFNFQDGLIIARPRIIEIKPFGYYPENV